MDTESPLLRALKETGKVALNLPFVSYEVDFAQLLNQKATVDERIARLSKVRSDLGDAIEAIGELQQEAQRNKEEAKNLELLIEHLHQDKATAENLLKLPEDSFARLLIRANAKARTRGLVEGIVIGFITGTLSSFLVWFLTK